MARPEVAVLVPVLARPQNAQPLADSLNASTDRARLVFICSPGDDEQIEACGATGETTVIVGWPPGRADYQRKINLGFALTSEPFVFTGADDLTFGPAWVEACLLAMLDGYGMCGTDDGANPLVRRGRHSTHSLFRRTYIEEQGGSADGPGTILSEAYDHQWCETETVELAKLRGEFVFAKHARILHAHPIWHTAEMDATYEKGLREGRADQRLFMERRKLWV